MSTTTPKKRKLKVESNNHHEPPQALTQLQRQELEEEKEHSAKKASMGEHAEHPLQDLLVVDSELTDSTIQLLVDYLNAEMAKSGIHDTYIAPPLEESNLETYITTTYSDLLAMLLPENNRIERMFIPVRISNSGIKHWVSYVFEKKEPTVTLLDSLYDDESSHLQESANLFSDFLSMYGLDMYQVHAHYMSLQDDSVQCGVWVMRLMKVFVQQRWNVKKLSMYNTTTAIEMLRRDLYNTLKPFYEARVATQKLINSRLKLSTDFTAEYKSKEGQFLIGRFPDRPLLEECVSSVDGKLVKDPTFMMMGKVATMHRSIGFFSNESRGYAYSNQLMASQPLTESLTTLLNRVNHDLSANYNGILINNYQGKDDYISAHSDDENSLGDIGVFGIVLNDIGRRFVIRAKHAGITIKNKVQHTEIVTSKAKEIVLDIPELKDCRMYLMSGDFQDLFTHEVPKARKAEACSERWSFTFRHHTD